jgi:GT2 family glycosyltransferase
MISLIIPVTDTGAEYTENIIRNIRELYPNENEVEIVLQKDSNVTLGINYNNAVSKAKGDKIILLHNDMVISKGFIETMDKHIVKNRITTYTRIEPPIYLDTYPGKVIADCGSDLETFNKDKFEQLITNEELIDGGSQLFFGCMKEDYIGIDGYTFAKFCEDDDLHLRYKLLGFEHKVSSAYVYHFVSKTSRQGDYQKIEQQSNKNFIRKWGFRYSQYNKKYNIGFVVNKCNLPLLQALEPWCNTIYIDDTDVLTSHYLDSEQPNAKINLADKIKVIGYTSPNNDIIVKFDGNKLTQDSFNLLIQLPDIITESGEIGSFELDIFKIEIKTMNEYQNTLIKL